MLPTKFPNISQNTDYLRNFASPLTLAGHVMLQLTPPNFLLAALNCAFHHFEWACLLVTLFNVTIKHQDLWWQYNLRYHPPPPSWIVEFFIKEFILWRKIVAFWPCLLIICQYQCWQFDAIVTQKLRSYSTCMKLLVVFKLLVFLWRKKTWLPVWVTKIEKKNVLWKSLFFYSTACAYGNLYSRVARQNLTHSDSLLASTRW